MRLCVFCGSSSGSNPRFAEAARHLGRIVVERQIGLVYGGGATGLMSAIASSVLANGGQVTGVIPDFLVNREGIQPEIQECVVVGDMHERKRQMFERADAFVALPGGIGTLEELAEHRNITQERDLTQILGDAIVEKSADSEALPFRQFHVCLDLSNLKRRNGET